jgi:rRNA-processing protein FCF1
MRVRLRPGVAVDDALVALETLSANAWATASPVGSTHPQDRRNAYIQWTVRTEQELSRFLPHGEVNTLFENPRHRDISLVDAGEHLNQLINAEIAAKQRQLQQMASDLRADRDRFGGDGTPGVIDTNVLIEHQRPDSVDWLRILGSSRVRLLVPLRVIEEIDATKYSSRDRHRQVARDLIPWLSDVLANGTGPVAIRTDTTLEVLLEGAPRHRPVDADEEILDVAGYVQALTGSGALITADTAMRLRAQALGISVLPMDDRYVRSAGSPSGGRSG